MTGTGRGGLKRRSRRNRFALVSRLHFCAPQHRPVPSGPPCAILRQRWTRAGERNLPSADLRPSPRRLQRLGLGTLSDCRVLELLLWKPADDRSHIATARIHRCPPAAPCCHGRGSLSDPTLTAAPVTAAGRILCVRREFFRPGVEGIEVGVCTCSRS
jgi:hypothetical protein